MDKKTLNSLKDQVKLKITDCLIALSRFWGDRSINLMSRQRIFCYCDTFFVVGILLLLLLLSMLGFFVGRRESNKTSL